MHDDFMESMMQQTTPVFSICIPTYNRGERALEVVRTLLPDIEDDWEILVLNNASDKGSEYYDEIARLAETDSRMNYVCHDSNRFFQGNYLACFDYASSAHIMIVSDEDQAVPDGIRRVLPFLQETPSIGILRGTLMPADGVEPRNSCTFKNRCFAAGEDAMTTFGLVNNYMSGTIYNRRAILEYGLHERLRQNLDKNRLYPHLYIELMICAVCDVAISSVLTCLEGSELFTSGGDPVAGEITGVLDYAAPYSYGSRIDQFIILRNAIIEAVGLVSDEYDLSIFINMYFRLCKKYFMLISHVNSPLYQKNQMNIGLLQKSFFYFCTSAVSEFPQLQELIPRIFDGIEEIYNEVNVMPDGHEAKDSEIMETV